MATAAIMILMIMVIVSSAATVRALPSSQLMENQARADYESGKYAASASLLKHLLKIYPRDTSLLSNLAAAEGELSNYTGALSLYKKMLSIDPKDIGAFVGIGLSLKHLGNNTTAMKYFKEAVAQSITDSRFVKTEELGKAMALVYLGNYSKAIDIANQILKQYPDDSDGQEIKAMALIYMNKASDALIILNELVSEGHTGPWILDDRGVVLLGLKNYAGAIANFNATLKAEPMDAYALFNRAEAFLNMDFYSQPYSIQQLERHHHYPLIFSHLDAALRDLNKVLSIDPYDKDARDLKSLLIEGLKLGYIKNGSNTVGTTPSISNEFSSNNGTEEMKVLNWYNQGEIRK